MGCVHLKRFWKIAAVVAIVVCGLFVWPTEYQYHKTDQNLTMRTNRITGTTAVWKANTWQEPEKPKAVNVTKRSGYLTANKTSVTLGDVVLQKINTKDTGITTMIINHSGHTIKVTHLQFVALDQNSNEIKNQCSNVHFAFGGLPMYGGQISPVTTWPKIETDPAITSYQVIVSYTGVQ
jgi:hypothetical protein